MSILCIVDMQYDFQVKNHSRVANNVEREIRQSIKKSDNIIMVEYQHSGPTISQLVQAVKNYPKSYFITKYSDDGSSEIEDIIRRKRLPKTCIKLSGVNTDCCILSTAKGLKLRFPQSKIEIVSDACDSAWDHNTGLERLKEIGCQVY